MGATKPTSWKIKGESVVSCNCAWGCPCQFNALPTHGRCEALAAWQIAQGNYGKTRLDGVRFAIVVSWPGAIHEGNGTKQWIIDESANAEQRAALVAMQGGKEGGAYFEIFAAVAPNVLETLFLPITLEIDRKSRRAHVRIPGVAEDNVEPIKNPVSGEEHQARIVLPNGFEYREAEMANSVSWTARAGSISMQHENTYGQLNATDWKNA